MVIATPAPPSSPTQNIEEYARACYLEESNATAGRPNPATVTDRVARWLIANPEKVDTHRIAYRTVTAIDRELRANIADLLQTSFFGDVDTPTFLNVGRNARIRTDLALETDWDNWFQVRRDEHKTQVDAFRTDRRIYGQVKEAWKPGQTLRDVRDGLARTATP